MPSVRRKVAIASRRRVDDEGEEDGGPDMVDVDDSLSEGSVISDDDDAADGSDFSQVDAQSKHSPAATKSGLRGRKEYANQEEQTGEEAGANPPLSTTGTTDTEMMLNGLKIADHKRTVEEVTYEELHEELGNSLVVEPPSTLKSTAQMDLPQETLIERRRREHEDYKKKRDADPAFVPNRGAFFMHDHRHAGPAANGFRPFGRGRGRGRGGPFIQTNHISQMREPTDAPWTHDMHEVGLEADNRNTRFAGNRYLDAHTSARPVSQAPRGPSPNRSLSTTKHIGNVQLRVFLDHMKEPTTFAGVPIKQYTCLPDHRPPLRRDKPVRISLPEHPPRYIFPAIERSFIFIPRAMRPNQQGFGPRNNRGRSGFGSIGGYSRQTSLYGGSVYGSVYTPSVAMSRRSSLAFEVSRDTLISPTGSNMSRAAMPTDSSRPIVRLPPASQKLPLQEIPVAVNGQVGASSPSTSSAQNHPYPLPQKPTFRENRPNSIPMHQPRPQKTVSVAGIESPATLAFNPPQQYQQPFHQQVPVEVHGNGNGYSHESHLHPHSRNASYPSQASTGTPLSQIPERAIHAQPFQPNQYQQSQGFYPQQYHAIPPQQGYFYPQQYNHVMPPPAPSFAPAVVPQQSFGPAVAQDPAPSLQGGQAGLVAQEVNGMVYYYDASQLPVTTFPAFSAPPSYPMQQVSGIGMQHGMMTPSPDGFYYPQNQQGVVYYP